MRSKSATNSQARERTGRHWYPDDGESRFTARTFPVDSSSHSCRLRYLPWHASKTSLAFILAPLAQPEAGAHLRKLAIWFSLVFRTGPLRGVREERADVPDLVRVC